MSFTRESLRELYLSLDEEMRSNYQRSLPLDEYIFDRFERAKALSAGENSSVHHSCYVYGNVKIGTNSWVGPFTLLDGSGNLEIGDNCSISSGVHIYSHDTVQKRLSLGVVGTEKDSVAIGNSCYVGPQSVIGKGVKLGEFCVVGANSFVSTSFPSYSVILGTPAKLRGKVVIEPGKKPRIEWLPKEGIEDKIMELEKKIRALEEKVNAIEKA